jgi:hypothetical protein
MKRLIYKTTDEDKLYKLVKEFHDYLHLRRKNNEFAKCEDKKYQYRPRYKIYECPKVANDIM